MTIDRAYITLQVRGYWRHRRVRKATEQVQEVEKMVQQAAAGHSGGGGSVLITNLQAFLSPNLFWVPTRLSGAL